MSNPSWQLGKYRIIGEVGRGGMAVVYKAIDPDLGRAVAIKVLLDALAADPGFVKRFRNEARMAARLQHPNIVTIHDVGSQSTTAGPKHFMVMEFLSGVNLDSIIAQNGPLTLAAAAQVVEQVAAALEEARKNDIVHRDVKPANIMVGQDGRVKLTDFGLVRAGEVTGLTHVGQIMGTPEYMAPEQARGESIDHRTDIYSLGIVLYKMLSGQSPFARSEPLATLYAHVTQELPFDGALASLPREVKRILQKATAKSREQRYQSAAQFAADLLKAAGAQPGRPLVLAHHPVRPPARVGASPSPSAPKSKPSAPRVFGRGDGAKSQPPAAPAPVPPSAQSPVAPPAAIAEETRLIQSAAAPAPVPAAQRAPLPPVAPPPVVPPAAIAPAGRPRPWLAGGLIALLLVLVAGGAFVALGSSRQGARAVLPTETQSVASLRVTPPTPIILVTREVIIATEVVVATQIVVVTSTPEPPTPTVPPTRTPLPEPTATTAPTATLPPSPTPSPPTATPDAAATRALATRAAATRAAATGVAATRAAQAAAQPTATPRPPQAVAPRLLPAPVLLSPANDAGASGQTEFRWNWAGALGPNQAFELRIWKEGQGHWGATGVTRNLSVTFDPSTAPNVGGASGTYNWAVIVLNLDQSSPAPASDESAPARINIQSGGGGGGNAPAPEQPPCPPGGC